MKKYVLERRNGNYWVEYASIMENYTRNRRVVFVQTGKRVFTEPAINE